MQVKFQSRCSGKSNWDDVDDDDISCYISIESPDADIKGQRYPDEIVIPMNEIRIQYTYPLTNPAIMIFNSDKETGFTRAELVRKVCDGYKKIYDAENAVGDPGYLTRFLNRAKSDGPYGIWGHYIGDLVLHEVRQIEGNLFGLGVDS